MGPTATAIQDVAASTPIRQTIPGSGLCRTCVKAAECTFPRSPGHIVRSCDEFEGADGPRSTYPPLEGGAPIFPAADPAGVSTAELKGLCGQCARRQTCTYPKPAGGVWHCDELA
jgi:hypothetical protein